MLEPDLASAVVTLSWKASDPVAGCCCAKRDRAAKGGRAAGVSVTVGTRLRASARRVERAEKMAKAVPPIKRRGPGCLRRGRFSSSSGEGWERSAEDMV